jgi:hypothetical protein
MVLLGKDAKVEVSTDDITYYEIDGINDVSWPPKRDQEETTDFKSASAGSGDYDEAKTYTTTLSDGQATLSGFFRDDANGQDELRYASITGDLVYIQVLWDGTNGSKVSGYVSSFGTDGESTGLLAVSITVDFAGAISAVP